jgi:fimbrial chaperone protein
MVTGFTTGLRLPVLLLAVIGLAWTGSLRAQTIAITPIGISLNPGQATTSVQVTNRGTEIAAVQARPFAWSQVGGEEQLSPTPNLVVSPPLVRIAPGQTQIVRLLLKAPASAGEASYRILFDQLPTQPSGGGIRVALRISIPVFALPPAPVRSRLVWRAVAGSAGEAKIIVVNQGQRHVRLNDLKLSGGVGPLSLRGPGTFYLLPGSQRELIASGPGLKAGTELRVSASSDEGDIAAGATIQPQP